MTQTVFNKEEREQIYQEFKEAVNMTPSELEKWLKTDESKEVGYKEKDNSESVGHKSGRKIIDILNTKKSDLTDSDYAHMRKVVGYVHRHKAQRPSGNIDDTPWRYSLKNWGHEPKKS
jgi:DNA topoisomerase VI subunit B